MMRLHPLPITLSNLLVSQRRHESSRFINVFRAGFLHHQHINASSTSSINPALKALRLGVQSHAAEFEITKHEAVQRFEQYQQQKCRGMQASGLLTQPHATIVQALLPFWAFDVQVSSEVKGALGFKDSNNAIIWKEMDDAKKLLNRAKLSSNLDYLQIYASYRLTRDVADGAKAAPDALKSRMLGVAEAQSLCTEGSQVPIDAPTMRQGIAWQLAYRSMIQQQLKEASQLLQRETGAAEVKDLHITLQVHERHCHLLYLPAYIANYQHGTRYKLGTSGVIVPQTFTAVISGTKAGSLNAPVHVSGIKAEATTAGLVMSLGFVCGLGSLEVFTLALLAAASVGLWARQLTHTARNKAMAQLVAAEHEFYKEYDARETKTAAAAAAKSQDGQHTSDESSDDYMLWLWMDADWRRWESDEPWHLTEAERRQTAEDIWKRQMQRKVERLKYVERLRNERLRLEHEEATEARRARVYGQSRGWSSGPNARAQHTGRRDFLGYYKVLGVDIKEAVSTENIKAAFKLRAMELHPDRNMGAEEHVRRQAHNDFQKLQMAYDVLRDPDKRRQYDRGQLVND